MDSQQIRGEWELVDEIGPRETPEEVLRRVQILAELLDNRFVLPGTNFRFGLDSLIGLIPGIGDLATSAISSYIVYLAHSQGIPKHVLARMIWNVAVDTGLGIVPGLGDLFDFAWKSNSKNARLLERHLLKLQSRNSKKDA